MAVSYRARVSRVDSNGVYVEIPLLAPGYEYGPCEMTTPADLVVGDRVMVTYVGDVPDDVVIIGKMVSKWDGTGTIVFDAVVSMSSASVLGNIAVGGQVTWAGDTSLYRSGPDILKTDDEFEAASAKVHGLVTLDRSDAGSLLITKLTSDAGGRIFLRSDGVMYFGDGTGTLDTDLYRFAANVLKTDDAFEAADLYVVGSQPVSAINATAETAFTNTSPSAGVNTVGFAFVAPRSGKVYITTTGFLESDTGIVMLAFELRAGSTIGSGTVINSADQGDALLTRGTVLNASIRLPVTGLTPGSTYNVRTMHWVTSGQGWCWNRRLEVEPVH